MGGGGGGTSGGTSAHGFTRTKICVSVLLRELIVWCKTGVHRSMGFGCVSLSVVMSVPAYVGLWGLGVSVLFDPVNVGLWGLGVFLSAVLFDLVNVGLWGLSVFLSAVLSAPVYVGSIGFGCVSVSCPV